MPTLDTLAERLERSSEDIASLTTRIAEVPAATGEEAERAALVCSLFRARGFDASLDAAGNVIAILDAPGVERSGALLVSAHLDCAYASGTAVLVRREGNILHAPGIGDDSAGVASMLIVAEAIRSSGVRLGRPLILAATVGEEGRGGLRGIRAIFEACGKDIAEAIAIDGSFCSIVNRAIAIRRHRITVRGPGGHSWGHHGRPSAVTGIARIAAAMSAIEIPQTEAKTIINLGRIGGGTAVNVIAAEAWLEVDLRSESDAALDALEREALACIGPACEDGLRSELKTIDCRPSGFCPEHSPIVRDAVRAIESIGEEAFLRSSSTEANIPLSIGLPAIAFGVARSFGAHTLDEYLEVSSLGPGAAALASLILRRAAPR